MNMILAIEQIHPQFPRYIIRAANDLVWSGEGWVRKGIVGNKPLVYSSWAKANEDRDRLMRKQFSEKHVVRLVAPTEVLIYGSKDFDLEEAQHYFGEATKFTLDYDMNRPEGLEDAVYSGMIHWFKAQRRRPGKRIQ